MGKSAFLPVLTLSSFVLPNLFFCSSEISSTVAVALWALDASNTPSPKLSLVADNFIDGGVGPITINNPGWSPRGLTN